MVSWPDHPDGRLRPPRTRPGDQPRRPALQPAAAEEAWAICRHNLLPPLDCSTPPCEAPWTTSPRKKRILQFRPVGLRGRGLRPHSRKLMAQNFIERAARVGRSLLGQPQRKIPSHFASKRQLQEACRQGRRPLHPASPSLNSSAAQEMGQKAHRLGALNFVLTKQCPLLKARSLPSCPDT